jgi:hypothetical protein
VSRQLKTMRERFTTVLAPVGLMAVLVVGAWFLFKDKLGPDDQAHNQPPSPSSVPSAPPAMTDRAGFPRATARHTVAAIVLAAVVVAAISPHTSGSATRTDAPCGRSSSVRSTTTPREARNQDRRSRT